MSAVTREEIIGFLQSLEVRITDDTPMPIELLDKKLEKALDAAQYVVDLIPIGGKRPSKMVDMAKLQPWPNKKSLREGVRRKSTIEATLARPAEGADGHLDHLPQGVFRELRRLVWMFGNEYDKGNRKFVLRSEDGRSVIALKIKEVRLFKTMVPIILVEYAHFVTDGQSLVIVGTDVWDGPEVRKFECGGSTQILLLRLLDMNRHRLPAGAGSSQDDDGWRSSFLLPIGPIETAELGQLNKHQFCANCLGQSSMQCLRCYSVFYCSDECNVEHWKNGHKQQCRSLEEADWVAFRIDSSGDPTSKQRVTQSINRRDCIERMAIRPKQHVSTINKHGNEPFILKVQDIGEASPYLMIYDRTKSLNAFLKRNSSRDFKKLEEAMNETFALAVGNAKKTYLWAKRKSDREVSLALDVFPDQDIVW